MILSRLGLFLIHRAISALYTYFLVMLKCAVPAGILGSFKLLFGGGGKAVFRTKISLFIIDVAIFSKEFFNVGVVLNCWGLVYLRAVQYQFLS